jgi:hypothetical protein
MKQRITWTAIPNGIDTVLLAGRAQTVLKLSVRVTPRLVPDHKDTPISEFYDWKDWAGKPWRFSVFFGDSGAAVGGPTVAGLKPVNTLDTKLWGRFFGEDSPVVVRFREKYRFADTKVRSFPAFRIHEAIRSQYSSAARQFPTELPPEGWYTGRMHEKSFISIVPPNSDVIGEYVPFLDKLLAENKVIPADYGGQPPHPKQELLDFVQASIFFLPKGGKYDQKPDRPEIDFHQAVALLGEYPALMRALGLIFDLEVPLPRRFAIIAPRILRVVPETELADGDDARIALGVKFIHDHHRRIFAPQPQGTLVRNGFLDLSAKEFSSAQVDIDGAVMKALSFAGTAHNLMKHGLFGSPENLGLPALRSGGMSVLMSDHAAALVKKLERGGDLEEQLESDSTQIELMAEDLIRGFRVDVRDEKSSTWHSLCRRRGRYIWRSGGNVIFSGHPAGEVVDEGVVTVTPSASTDPEAEDELFLHESLFHWDGWSLAVPQPGKMIKEPEANASDNNVGDVAESDLENVLDLKVSFKVVERSLPRLRYGRSYRLRARLVDIAGNSRACGPNDDTQSATPPTPYLRFEPVPAPALVSEDTYIPGESAERLVIRSWEEHGENPSEEAAIRYLLAPRASIQTAELHGAIDGPAPDGGASWYQELAKRDKAGIPGFRLPQPPPVPLPPDYRDPPPFYPEQPVPYLPDPLAEGMTVSGLPGPDGPERFAIPFRNTEKWPYAANNTLRLIEGEIRGWSWDASLRLLTVTLPKAEKLILRLSSTLPQNQNDPNVADEALAASGIWAWMKEDCPSPLREKLRQLVLDGRHWMITPFRELTLVHAVQRPLSPPAIHGPYVRRTAGSSCYSLVGRLAVHARSTERVDVLAKWEDIKLDYRRDPGFIKVMRVAQACQVKVGDPESDLVQADHLHELGDTKHRRIAYWLTATSRFREYFENEFDPHIETGIKFTTPSTDERPADFMLEVPSSVRPEAPKVEYIIPTFAWEETRNDHNVFRQRTSNSLRVYMQGDWFSSGQGELLGVLTAGGPEVNPLDGTSSQEIATLLARAPIPPEGLEQFISRWGTDPIRLGGLVSQLPTTHDFPAAVAREYGLQLAEVPKVPAEYAGWNIAVAGHEVAYDCERGLWYCDIPMESGPAYYPFVRLALARYQPCSIKGCEISRVVTADCVQTAPDRMLSVSADPDDPRDVQVTVSGIAPLRSEKVAWPNWVIARAEACIPKTEAVVWVPVQGPWTVLTDRQVTKHATVWHGGLRLPQTRASQRYRIVVEEYELLTTDPGRGIGSKEVREQFMMSARRVSSDLWPRLVYSDAIEIGQGDG